MLIESAKISASYSGEHQNVYLKKKLWGCFYSFKFYY